MKHFLNLITIFLLAALLCACAPQTPVVTTTPPTQTQSTVTEPTQTQSTVTEPTQTQPTETTPPEPVTISTTGGVVLVGTVGHDEQGWFLTPLQPLDVTYEYFLDQPSEFLGLTRIFLFDSTIDGIEKGVYLGQTVTVEGSLRFYRNEFEKLYLVPYEILLGKTVAESYAAPDLQPPDLTQSRYDPAIPLPAQMSPTTVSGTYTYNPYMLSMESLELMGNDFAAFYCDFVSAFLQYEAVCPCPDGEFAQMLSTVIFYEFPLYAVCAEDFEFVKHYDAGQGTVTIPYKYDRATHEDRIGQFLESANAFLSTAKEGMTQQELAKNIYHQLCTRVTYDDSALEDFRRKDAWYAYMEHSGVCVTFANVYNQLLTQVGIRATTAQCDYTETLGHVWSLVTLDGQQYFCDPTFELNAENGRGYVYFCQNFARRLADGLGAGGITGGRYYPYPLDASMLAP